MTHPENKPAGEITIPVLMTPRDFARVAQICEKQAQAIFYSGTVPTVRIGRRRRMSYETFKKHFLNKAA